MYEIFLFAGTTEGRVLAEQLGAAGKRVCVFVATEYGETRIPPAETVHVESARLTEPEMEARFLTSPEAVVIDATHPYAALVTENIRTAAAATGHRLIRVLRESEAFDETDLIRVDTPEEAAAYLSGTEGNVLLTTGSKELSAFTAVPDYENRLYARVLSLPKVVSACAELGFQGAHLICMQGPFSEELNCALLHQTEARYLVTKDTGVTGGFPEKLRAARACGCRVVLIGRPLSEEGISVEACLKLFGIEQERKIALIGIGMGGNSKTLTVEAEHYCAQADLLIGAERMVRAVQHPGQAVLIEYRAEEIASYLRTHTQYLQIAVLLSGDVGFFSGAKRLLEQLPDGVSVMPGIGSLVYFCSQLHTSWEDVKITSSHGRSCNLIAACRSNRKVFSLLGKAEDVRNFCRKCVEYGLDGLRISVGERFGYPEEKLVTGAPSDFLNYEGTPLSVLLAENDAPDEIVTHGIPDEAFTRAKVPMTKEEVRDISLSKLRLKRDSVVYDVGAGSGSVSVEIALQASEGQVYAIEKNPDAVALLHENRKKFCADHMEIIEGTAPEALEALPAPTHAFIGGSSGNLKEILSLLLRKNPTLRVVINAITLETVSEALEALAAFPFTDEDVVSVSAAKSRQVGRYHMMMGQNPVYIISATGKGGQA